MMKGGYKMEDSRRGEIAVSIIKYLMRKHGVELSQNNMRQMGIVAKETGIPVAEIREFVQPLLEEMLAEFFFKQPSLFIPVKR
ncbi:MAG: hypothetical protein WCP17_00545 [bacterium]